MFEVDRDGKALAALLAGGAPWGDAVRGRSRILPPPLDTAIARAGGVVSLDRHFGILWEGSKRGLIGSLEETHRTIAEEIGRGRLPTESPRRPPS